MSFYKSPLRPIDPLIEVPGKPCYHYFRDNFYGAGQDSFSKPFSQNQELFQSLTNVMPVAEGTFRLRHGYQLFSSSTIPVVQRMYSYQNIEAGTRSLLYSVFATIGLSQLSSIYSSGESGTGFSLVTTSSNGFFPSLRVVTSRDYAFIPQAISSFTWGSSQQSDGKKWHSVNGLSDWGLARPASAVNVTSTAAAGNITLASTVGRVYAGAFLNSTTGHYSDENIGIGSFSSGVAGPSLPTAAAQDGSGDIPWSNPTNIELDDGTSATALLSSTFVSSVLSGTGFGFAIPGTATIYGIQVAIKKAGVNTITDLNVQLLKAGVATGQNKADTVTTWPLALTYVNYGGSADLWGTTWSAADINNANFGIAITAQNQAILAKTASVDAVKITVTYATGGGSNTGAITSKQVAIALPTANPPAGADKFAILATLDGGDTTTFYVVDTVPVANSTYTDNTPDNVLVTKNRATEVDGFGIIHGLQNNNFPPLNLLYPTKHRGRLYGAVGGNIYFSKSLDEVTTSTGLVAGRHEEAWPVTNFHPVSTEKETIRGLLSDGNTLYIGTERHIWRLDGDGPLNFSKPEVTFNEVGVLNQDCWQICFAEGQPVGMSWLTPDNRVIMSNFATYQDIGTPIQDVLSSINSAPSNPAWAGFFSRQEFDVFILAAPTGSNNSPDTLCVYDLRTGRWFIWKPTDQLTAGLFNITAAGGIQWLISASSGKTYQFLPTATQDRVGDTPVSYTATIQTPWYHLGKPDEIKALNEIEVITGDTGLLVTVEGANTFSQTSAPVSVVSNAALTTSIRGLLKTYLAGSTTKNKFYRFTFTSSGGIQDVLQGYIIEAFTFPY